MNIHTHIVLVSAQAAPNLLPALDPALKPQEAILLVSEKMRPKADALEKVFKQNGVKIQRIALEDVHDYAKLETSLMNLAAERDGQAIALNVTGGTKLMALAAQSIAQAAGWPVFYVDVDTDEAIWLGNPQQPRHPLTEQLKLRHYLMGYGYDIEGQIERPQPDAKLNQLIDTLILQIGSLEQPLSQLNWLTQLAEDKKRLTVEMDDLQRDSIGLANLLRHFEEADVLKVQGAVISYADEARRSFAKGGWLEHYVYNTVCRITGRLGIRDKASNLHVIDGSGVKNELDVAFMARNRLFVVECKTARMDKPEAPKANDTLFKLAETAGRIGGLGTHKMLASYRPLRDAEKKLAQALHIKLACGTELQRLEEKLSAWINN